MSGARWTSSSKLAGMPDRGRTPRASRRRGPRNGPVYGGRENPARASALIVWRSWVLLAFNRDSRICESTEFLHALLIRYAGPTAPLKADSFAAVSIMITARECPTINAVLAVPVVTAPDSRAAPAIAKPVAAFAVLRAIAIRHILRPGTPPKVGLIGRALRGDHLIEQGEGLGRRERCGRLNGGGRRLCGVLDAPTRRRFLPRRAGCYEKEAEPSYAQKVCHAHGHTHAALLFVMPGPPR